MYLRGYPTSQKITSLHRGEIWIQKSRHPEAYELAGLSYDTKFNLRELVWLPYNATWFTVPPAAPHGQQPRLGLLHPSLMQAAHAAYHAARAD